MNLERLKIDTLCNDKNIISSVDEINVGIDNMHIDIQRNDYDVSTYGGEHHSSCECCGDLDIAYYGLQFDALSIEISPKTALNLFTVLAQHLQNNGHDLKEFLPKQDFYGNPC